MKNENEFTYAELCDFVEWVRENEGEEFARMVVYPNGVFEIRNDFDDVLMECRDVDAASALIRQAIDEHVNVEKTNEQA